MHAVIEQENSTRFRISQEDLPIEWDQLTPLSKEAFTAAFAWTEDGFSISGLNRESGDDDVHDYVVSLNPFKISQTTNGILTASTAYQPYFENGSKSAEPSNTDPTCFDALK